ncbi:hypothetical protein CHLRE_06g254275v5 [Chlamydomonas reinhardtii]|uniref:Uncharacterized protein n=1 Tax=Chlamydomonas reinhardtii TaxID=3055 RepID=A0A2K3DM85_CHLRE|nr:uncharacterized protein CHLRE_06g254275v5 [Chlamydomonas reinhardtii]PNW81645.1 hypothetical protein CHLRE_06g254275v5 [Chlamydomonas reinhardtii]
MTRFLLEHVLGPAAAGAGGFPPASLVTWTLEEPDWLRCWCARWGQPPAAPLRVLALFAFEAHGECNGAGGPRKTVWKVSG